MSLRSTSVSSNQISSQPGSQGRASQVLQPEETKKEIEQIMRDIKNSIEPEVASRINKESRAKNSNLGLVMNEFTTTPKTDATRKSQSEVMHTEMQKLIKKELIKTFHGIASKVHECKTEESANEIQQKMIEMHTEKWQNKAKEKIISNVVKGMQEIWNEREQPSHSFRKNEENRKSQPQTGQSAGFDR
jgi:hypothetical protein